MRDDEIDGSGSKLPRQVPRDGGDLIKGFVHEAEQRRIACRHSEDDQLEVRPEAPLSHVDNQQEEDTAAIVGGLFTVKHVHHRNRQISLTPAMLPAAAAAAASGLGINNKPIFTFTRRKLQMESVNAGAQTPGLSRNTDNGHRTAATTVASPTSVTITTSHHLGHRSRASNLAAKLDAILRSSPWMRRKVVMQAQLKGQTQRTLSNTSTLRILASPTSPVHHHQEIPDVSSGSANENPHKQRKGGHTLNEVDSSELDKRIIATFQRCKCIMRKRRAEQAALNLVHGNSRAQPVSSMGLVNGSNVPGRNGGKMRREIDAQSSNMASILSRRVIGEVPALKFFDEDEPILGEQTVPDPILIAVAAARARSLQDSHDGKTSSSGPIQLTKLHARTLGDLMVPSSIGGGSLGTSPHRRLTPRGVCYTLDESGCRRIKMQSGAPARTRTGAHKTQGSHKKSEDITVERATSKILRRKYAGR
ncbi:unnamed protein product [Phytophthora fragariaefolia]|uniref:Unnamed protein product n=1 Tax=Phytophthora fragariaefolia TaxID=1490495 RepID=A0A9W6XH34_9STRA|nr:unnamed protein product [Phytophthora fragariaefolia]